MSLKLDWCGQRAAEFACNNYHYAKRIPHSKLVKIGVWEDEVFIGCVIFGYGANPNIGTPYGLTQYETCELLRVALKEHKTTVTRIISISIGMLKKQSPGLKLIVSYADPDQGHVGKIYQAGNWVYVGLYNKGSMTAYVINGEKRYTKTIGDKFRKYKGKEEIAPFEWVRKYLDPKATKFYTKGKHKYLMPLTNEMREQIGKLSKPYPR